MAQQQAVAKRQDARVAPQAASTTGLQTAQVHQFVTEFKDDKGNLKHYVGMDGITYKMDERFGAGKWNCIADLPTPERYRMLRIMWGIPNEKPAIIMEATVHVGGSLLARDWGTATPGNVLGGENQFWKRGIEIATTRAKRRACRQLVAGGFDDPDNVADSRYRPMLDSPQGEWFRRMQDLKKTLGEETYYRALEAHGINHSNEMALMTDPDMMQEVWDELRIEAGNRASAAVFDTPQETSEQDETLPPLLPGQAVEAPEEAQEQREEPPLPPDPPQRTNGAGKVRFITEEGATKLTAYAGQFGVDPAMLLRHAAEQYGVTTLTELTTDQYKAVRLWVQEQKPE